MTLKAQSTHRSGGPRCQAQLHPPTRVVRTRGGNLSASVFRPSLSALASRSLGGRRYHPPGAISFLHSRRGALVERIGPATQPFRCALQLEPGALKRYYPCLGAGAPQICPVSGRLVCDCNWTFTCSGLAHGRACSRRVFHSGNRSATVWRLLFWLVCVSSPLWTRRFCQAHSAVGDRRLTCADCTLRPLRIGACGTLQKREEIVTRLKRCLSLICSTCFFG